MSSSSGEWLGLELGAGLGLGRWLYSGSGARLDERRRDEVRRRDLPSVEVSVLPRPGLRRRSTARGRARRAADGEGGGMLAIGRRGGERGGEGDMVASAGVWSRVKGRGGLGVGPATPIRVGEGGANRAAVGMGGVTKVDIGAVGCWRLIAGGGEPENGLACDAIPASPSPPNPAGGDNGPSPLHPSPPSLGCNDRDANSGAISALYLLLACPSSPAPLFPPPPPNPVTPTPPTTPPPLTPHPCPSARSAWASPHWLSAIAPSWDGSRRGSEEEKARLRRGRLREGGRWSGGEGRSEVEAEGEAGVGGGG